MLVAELAPKAVPQDFVALAPAGRIPFVERSAVAELDPLPQPQQPIEPLTSQIVRFRFNGRRELLEKVGRARDLLRHKYPRGALEDIFSDAVDALLDKKDPSRWRIRPRR